MKHCLALLAIAAMLLVSGCSPAAIEIEEDDPRWECLTMGNKVCGGTEADRVEAWGAVDPSQFTDSTKEVKLSYLGKGLVGIDFPPADYYTVPAKAGGYVHVFRVERL